MNPSNEDALEMQKRNFRYVQIDAIGVSISNVAAPFLPVFLTRLGASNFQVGLLSSMPGVTGMVPLPGASVLKMGSSRANCSAGPPTSRQ